MTFLEWEGGRQVSVVQGAGLAWASAHLRSHPSSTLPGQAATSPCPLAVRALWVFLQFLAAV